MSDEITNKIIDTYLEHIEHLLYQPNCSTCWSENLRIQSEDPFLAEKHNDNFYEK